jgi:hypothetical protein
MRNLIFVAGLTALIGCGDKDDDSGDAGGSSSALCQDYIDAWISCYDNAGFEIPEESYSYDVVCPAWESVEYSAAAPILNCMIDAVEAGTCDESGYEAITAEITACATAG